MVYGYARVSTRGQQAYGNSLEAQREALLAAGCDEVVEEAFTGTRIDRPKLDVLMARLSDGDTLVVTKLDRIARTTVGGCTLVRDLIDSGVTVRVLNMGTLDASPIGKVMVSVMFAMAEFERDMIVQRTQEGKAVARATDPDFREGRPPKFDTEQLDHAMELLENHSYTQVVKLTGISKSTLIREKKRRQA